MSDQLEFRADTSALVKAVRALDQVADAAKGAEKAAGRYVDAQGRMREANGRFVSTAQQAAEAAQRQGAAQRAAAQATDTMGSAFGKLQGLAAGYLSLQTAKRVIQEADAWQAARARLALYAGSLENAARLQERLAGVALSTGQNAGGLIQSYTRMAQSARELGATQSQLIAVTKGVGDAFRVGGTDGANATAAAQQLAQALGSGVLAGDELKSILENSGRLAQAIADGLGVSVGQLKKLGAEGELTSRAVFLALLSQTRQLADETAKLPLTVSQGWQNMATAATVAIGRIDDAIGGTKWLARLLDRFAKGTIALSAPDLFNQSAGEDSITSNRALTATGAAQIFNAARLVVANRTRDIAALQAEITPEALRKSGMPLTEFERRQAEIARFENERAFARGQIQGVETRMAQGLAIDPALLRGEVARERLTGGAEKRAREAEAEARKLRQLLQTTLPGVDLTDFVPSGQEAMRRRRVAAGLEISTGDPVLDARLRALESGLGADFRGVRGASAIDSQVGRGRNNIVDASLVFGQRLRDEADQRAEEMRKLFTEQLARGVQDGLAGPIRQFLTQWQLNVKSMGEALRTALVNAVSAALANAATKQLFDLFGRVMRANGGEGGSGGAAGAATSLAGLVGGSPILSMAKGGGGAAAGGAGGAAKAASGAGLAAGAGKFAIGGIGLLAGGLLGNARGTTTGVLGGAGTGAAAGAAIGSVVPGIGTLVGGVIGGVAGVIGGLAGGNARRRRREAAEARAESSRSFLEDLGVRNAAASGDDAAAARLRLLAQQRQELEAIVKQFGATSREVARLRETQAAELRSLVESALGPGTYMGPSGYSPNNARFEAGRPLTFTGPITVTVPEGTPQQQAMQVVRSLQDMASAQGLPLSSWSQVQVT